MPTENQAASGRKAENAASGIQWHPGFCSAVEFELRENKDALEFLREFPLTKGPLFVDLLVIKKLANISTENEIGRIFRTYNVCEYKSPDDRLTIDDYFKVISYAGLVKNSGHTVNEIPAGEITISFVRDSFPREMVRALTASGAVMTEQYPGVYYLHRGKDGTGDILFPTQIIVTCELNRTAHSGLRILKRDAAEEDIRRFLLEALSETGKGGRANVDSIL